MATDHARITATGLGSPRNGLPAARPYTYRGTRRGNTDPAPNGRARLVSLRRTERLRKYAQHRGEGLSVRDAGRAVGVNDNTARNYEAALVAEVARVTGGGS